MSAEDIAREVKRSKKYAGVGDAVIARVAADMARRYAKPKDAVKAVKNELHRIHESFLLPDAHEQAHALLSAYEGSGMSDDRAFGLRLMALHASTRERLPHAEAACAHISRFVSESDTVMDLGCGFQPFALPFFGRKPAAYDAYDINEATVGLLRAYFAAIGRPAYRAALLDVSAEVPGQHADVALLLKLLPLLEGQRRGRAFALLEALQVRTAVVSFPLKSASGREKGMLAHYTAFFEGGLPACFAIHDKYAVENELFYVIGRTQPHTLCDPL